MAIGHKIVDVLLSFIFLTNIYICLWSVMILHYTAFSISRQASFTHPFTAQWILVLHSPVGPGLPQFSWFPSSTALMLPPLQPSWFLVLHSPVCLGPPEPSWSRPFTAVPPFTRRELRILTDDAARRGWRNGRGSGPCLCVVFTHSEAVVYC